MKQAILDLMREKAKEKKDWVYSLKWHNYLVKNNRVEYFSESNPPNWYLLYSVEWAFNVCIWSVEYRYEIPKYLKRLLNNNTYY